MSYDLVIRNGTVVDGTGAARVRADVAVKDGKIVEVGKVSGTATRTIDAQDLIVAPGFVDPHTHYDAQICWDSVTSPWTGNPVRFLAGKPSASGSPASLALV